MLKRLYIILVVARATLYIPTPSLLDRQHMAPNQGWHRIAPYDARAVTPESPVTPDEAGPSTTTTAILSAGGGLLCVGALGVIIAKRRG
ncbi:MAG: uncharacterized protein KVP18_004292 [Porospora cf. gigantea A]|nr:MAG: hypothetical protein KVP18_004292 [Porospora cf. gigantea A]